MDTYEDKNNIDELLEKVAELLNEASISSKESVKLHNLKHVQEIILNKCPTLLDNFLEEILPFQCDKSTEVKKFVVSFLEEACKKDSEVIFKVIDNFRYLLFDDNINVQKRSHLAMISIFKNTLKWIIKHKDTLDEEQQQTWQSIIDIKSHIVAQLDSDNDGIRTSSIKFLEMLIIVLSSRSKESLVPIINDNDISIEQLSYDNKLLDKNFLIEEGHRSMRKLLEYTLSSHISSVNLISSICVLSNIARQRPEYMNIVLNTYLKLLENIPPTLGKSQVSAVKKQIKLQVAFICKNNICVEFQTEIIKLLTDLGASQSEISKIIPKVISTTESSRKRSLKSFSLTNQNTSKKPKITSIQSQQNQHMKLQDTSIQKHNSVTLENIVDNFVSMLCAKENVIDLVILSMAYLPEKMPTAFPNVYKPISNAGSIQQISNLAHMLAINLNEAGFIHISPNENHQLINSSIEKHVSNTFDEDIYDEENEENDAAFEAREKENQNVFEIKALNNIESKTKLAPTPLTPLPSKPLTSILASKKSSNKTFKLYEVTINSTNQFNKKSFEELLYNSYSRVLCSEEIVKQSKKASLVRKRVLVESVSFPNYENHLTNYIFEDVKKRIDLSLMWIYNTYLKLNQNKNVKKSIDKMTISRKIDDEDYKDIFRNDKYNELNDLSLRGKEISNQLVSNEKQFSELIKKMEFDYDKTLYTVLFSLQQRPDSKDFLSKIICQSPLITDNCFKLIKNFCQDEHLYSYTLDIIFDLILTRINQREIFITMLLDFTHENNQSIRNRATELTLKLHKKNEFYALIENYSIERLKALKLPNPPQNIFNDLIDDHLETVQWTEEPIKACLFLFLELMPENHKLINFLSNIYVSSIAEVKRIILKMLETPIKKMGMASNELLQFLETFPQGAETLVLRIIHILTENTAPSVDLVDKVRELFHKRLPDVRFLIPILTGLSKSEIISALPQLIKLSQAVVKEVFNRLLGINGIHKSPISPADLLIALHQIDSSNCDLKTVINATSLCFAEKQIYTQEILATVMQQLIDVTPIPTLYMRTVIQSVTMYTKLTGFVIIMMQRLISKLVWKNPKVWEGFIKCCQRIRSISHQVLLQLPAPQLKEVFLIAPDLKEHIVKHVISLNPQQKSSIPDQLLQIIEQNIASISSVSLSISGIPKNQENL